MKKMNALLGAAIFAGLVASANAQLIKCVSKDNGKDTLWPAIYLEKGSLCFDVRGLTDFVGRNCVKPGGEVKWSAFAGVTVDGNFHGRDYTKFQVVKPVINSNVIEYTLEFARSMEWETMQRVTINRLTGDAISHYVEMHGGDSYTCKLTQPKL